MRVHSTWEDLVASPNPIKILLVLVTAICFLPVAAMAFFSLVALLVDAGGEAPGLLGNFLASASILAAAVSLANYILSGRRLISRSYLALTSLIGLFYGGIRTVSMFQIGPPYPAEFMIVPSFFLGLVLLYLGRSYFSGVNKDDQAKPKT